MLNTFPSLPGYFQRYLDQVKEKDLPEAFSNQSQVIKDFLPSITEEKSMFAYADGKWSLKELLQHIIDTERIFAFRALCFARKEASPLPGFEENEYAVASQANRRSWESLTAEFVASRRSTLYLFDSFTPEMLGQTGVANNNTFSVEQLGFLTVGHFNHHKRIIEERYLTA
ncbi:MAG: DinB family protein [Ferruginibacter sp.]|nr:DinB family protein [Ferruginibacter sp.]